MHWLKVLAKLNGAAGNISAATILSSLDLSMLGNPRQGKSK
jgi:hypothetical protein